MPSRVGVGEHHAESRTYRRPGCAPNTVTLTARIAALGQQRGQQAAGAAAEDRYPHRNSYVCQIIDERCFL